jgi:hypothetical protein
VMADELTYVEPHRVDGSIRFTLALQDGTRQPWCIADTLSNWHFAWWVYACDRPAEAAQQVATS